MWIKKSGVMKFSSINSYEKKRGDFIVRRFVKDCPCLSDLAKTKEGVDKLISEGEVEGFGSLLALSIVTG